MKFQIVTEYNQQNNCFLLKSHVIIVNASQKIKLRDKLSLTFGDAFTLTQYFSIF